MGDYMNNKGFTLIELLAVIVILGIILLIGIPSISSAVINVRKKTYIATANEFVDSIKTSTTIDASLLPTGNTPKYFSLNEIKLEKGSNTISTFGKAYLSDSYIKIVYNEETSEYIYSICLVDEAGNGISKSNGDSVNITDLTSDNVRIGTSTCSKVVAGDSNDWAISSNSNNTYYTIDKFTGNLETSDNVTILKDYYNDTNIDPDYLTAMGITSTSQMPNRDAYIITIPNDIAGEKIDYLGESLFIPIDIDNYDPQNPTISQIEPYMRIKEIIISEDITDILHDDCSGSCGLFGNFGSFTNDYNLTNVSLPSTLVTIGNGSFKNTSIKDLTIPKSVQVIYGFAFQNTGLNSLTLEGALDDTSILSNIEGYAFDGNNLSTITIPKSVTQIGSSAFNKSYSPIPWSSLTFMGASDSTSKLTTINKNAFYVYPADTTSPKFNVIIPSSVRTIGNYTFVGNNINNITVKRASSSGMTLGNSWNGSATIIWNAN